MIQEEYMRKYALLAALAGAIFAMAFGLPNRADAMTFSTPAGVLSAAETIDVAQPTEQVRWCGWRGCWGGYGYWRPRPYYYGYYRPWPYYGYYSSYYAPYPYYGWGFRRWWW
jgi:hypothetical protein